MNIIINKKDKINNFKNYNENIHTEIKNKLNYFIENHSIPHIIFYGKAGSGKIFIKLLY